MSGLCTRLGEKILRDVHDVINDVTNDVIFHLKKLILKPFLHIKLKEASTKVLASTLKKEHRLGFPKIGQDSRIDLRGPSYGARKVGDFRHFQTKLGERITDEP